jgi:hypothetical protein
MANGQKKEARRMEEPKEKVDSLRVQGADHIITSDSAEVVTERQIANIFLYEVTNQCNFALMAFEYLKQALNSNDALRIWYFIHGFITATGNISKLLWRCRGDSNKYVARKDKLRQRLSILDNSPLSNRNFRNYLEHFDRELQDWVDTTRSENYIDLSFGILNEAGLIDLGHHIEDVLRYFNYEESTVIFRGNSAELTPIIDAIKELKEKVEQEIETFKQKNKEEKSCNF